MGKRRAEGRIVLAPFVENLRQMSGADPPALSIDRARQRLGPELHQLSAAGWLDDDIIAALRDQNPEDVIELLKRAREDERRARRLSAKKKKIRKELKHASNAPIIPSLDRPTAAALMTPKQGNPIQPSLPASPSPPLAITFEVPRSDAEQISNPITRNRGVRRPD